MLKQVTNLKSAVELATIVIIDGEFYRCKGINKEQIVEGSEDACIYLTEEDSGKELSYTFDQLQDFDNDCTLKILTLTEVSW